MIAVKTGCNPLLQRRIRQQVTGQLLAGELIEGSVAVEGSDDVVPVRPDVARGIRMVSYGGSQNNISILVETGQKENALNLLNEGTFYL